MESLVGLCATCSQAKRIRNSRGSVFHLCLRADDDPTFSRYPRLPVLLCSGYAAATDGERHDGEPD